jgi:hypothetical protein
MQPKPTPTKLAAFRRIVLNVTIGLALFAVVIALVQPTKWVSDTLFAVSAAVSVASAVLVPILGRVPVLPMDLSAEAARNAGEKAFIRGIFLRFAVVDGAALFGLIAAYVVGSTVPYLVNGAVAIVLMLVFVRPTERHVRAAEQRLDSAGATSRLSEAFGI